MRKSRIATGVPGEMPPVEQWLDLDREAHLEITSEDPEYPIEQALIPGGKRGWKAAGPGLQTIRLIFDSPQRLHRIRLQFIETGGGRTQQFVLRWFPVDGHAFREVLRQQWTFSPQGSTHESEDYQVDLQGVKVLELAITPEISGGRVRASLAEMRVA